MYEGIVSVTYNVILVLYVINGVTVRGGKARESGGVQGEEETALRGASPLP